MKNIILALLLSSTASAAGVLINGNQINPQTAISIATFTQTGSGNSSFVGKVGIGTSSPSTKLDVQGTLGVGSGSSDGVIFMRGSVSSGAGPLIQWNAGGNPQGYSGLYSGIHNSVATDMDFEVAYATQSIILESTAIRMNTTTGTQVYYCNGGASIGNLCLGNGCSCAGGAWVATPIYLP